MFLFCHRYSAASSAASISGVMLFVSTTKGPTMGSSSLRQLPVPARGGAWT